MNADGYGFHLEFGTGRGVTSDEPPFSVDLGNRSLVTYEDPSNVLELGARFDGASILVSTRRLDSQIRTVPADMARDDYAELIMERIRAAARWEDREVDFTGPRR